MLTRISMWDDKHGWQRTTANQARIAYPYGLGRADYSKQFLCEICGQYANFVVGDYQQPHFRHNRNSRDCEQKSTTYNSIYTTNPRGFSLPLKIVITDNFVEVFIGFLPIPENALQTLSSVNGRLIIKENNNILRQYNIDSSRFLSERVTYLSVGNSLAEEYRLSYPDTVKNMKIYWPTVIDGINNQGTLFDYDSGKRLPRNANVIVGRDYLFITQQSYISQPSGVIITRERTIGRYSLYKIKAVEMSRVTDDFFRRYGGRLTDNPAILTLLYPFAVKNPHVITHTADKVWLHKTNGFVEIYPQHFKPNADVFCVNSDFQQMLSLSRFEDNASVLRYTLLRKVQSIVIPIVFPNIDIRDNRGEIISASEHITLPPSREIYIITEFDGFVDVRSEENTLNRIALKSGVKTIMDVAFNRSYHIYQGLDCVCEFSYARKKQLLHDFSDEDILLRLQKYKGQEVITSHSIGAIAYKLHGLPKTAMWLRSQLVYGKIDNRAKQLLQNIGGEEK